MGYFSNGSEGSFYEEKYCSRCVHRDGPDGKSGCMVWLAHLLYAYKLCNETEDEGKQILDLLIPRNKEDCFNARCAMFHEGEAVKPKELHGGTLDNPATVMPAMREWAKKHGLIVP